MIGLRVDIIHGEAPQVAEHLPVAVDVEVRVAEDAEAVVVDVVPEQKNYPVIYTLQFFTLSCQRHSP